MKIRISSVLAGLLFAAVLAFESMVMINPVHAGKKITIKPTNCKKASQKFRDKLKSKCSKRKNKERCIKKNRKRVKVFYKKCVNCNKKLRRKAKLVKQRCAKIKDKSKKTACLKKSKRRLKKSHKKCLKDAMRKRR